MLSRFLASFAAAFVALAPVSAQQFFVPSSSIQISSAGCTLVSGVIACNADDVVSSSVPFVADILIDGGGAGGGLAGGGGAGRPQLIQNVQFGTRTPVKVGRGGLGNLVNGVSNAGDFSAVYVQPTALVSTGGGPVGILNSNSPQFLTGSGGGASSASSGGPYLGGPSEGLSNENPGGGTTTLASPFPGGGGGGCLTAGGSATVVGHGGNGGLGCNFTIGALTVHLSAGGPGSCFSNGGSGCTPGTADTGAGAGATPGTSGIGGNGVDGTGSGGGAGYNVGAGGRGGDGIVYIFPHGTFAYNANAIPPSAVALVDAIGGGHVKALWSPVRLAGYTGNCTSVIRASDSGLLDIGFVNNVCDWGSADNFAAAQRSTWSLNKLYDYSGNGNDMPCTGSGPLGNPTATNLTYWNGIRPLNTHGRGNTLHQECSNYTITGVNANSASVISVNVPREGYDFQAYWSLQNSTGTGFFTSLYHNGGSDLRIDTLDTGFYPRQSLNTLSYSGSGTTGRIVRYNGTAFTNGTGVASNAVGGFQIGIANNGAGVFGIVDHYVFAIYDIALNQTQMAAAEAAFVRPFGQPTGFTKQLIVGGDSLEYGQSSTLNQQPQWQAGWGKWTNGPLPSWEPIIMGVAARTCVTENAVSSVLGTVFDATKSTHAFFTACGSNDITGFTCVSQVDCENQADTLYTGTILPLIASAQGFGYAVTIGGIIGRSNITIANFKEYARLKLNGDIAAGAVAHNYNFSDRANTGPGVAYNSPTQATDTTRYGDASTHLNNLGYFGTSTTDRTAITGGVLNFLLERDIGGPANDNRPVGLEKAA